MDPTKLKAMEQWELPKSVKAVRSFIRFCNFYRKFIPNFSTLAQLLHDLTKKGVAFLWGKEQDAVFVKLKETFLSTPVIKMPDTDKPFFVMTDASLMASGGVLMLLRMLAGLGRAPFFLLLGWAILMKRPTSSQ